MGWPLTIPKLYTKLRGILERSLSKCGWFHLEWPNLNIPCATTQSSFTCCACMAHAQYVLVVAQRHFYICQDAISLYFLFTINCLSIGPSSYRCCFSGGNSPTLMENIFLCQFENKLCDYCSLVPRTIPVFQRCTLIKGGLAREVMCLTLTNTSYLMNMDDLHCKRALNTQRNER